MSQDPCNTCGASDVYRCNRLSCGRMPAHDPVSLRQPTIPSPDGKNRAIVVRNGYTVRMVKRHFPHHYIFSYGEALAGFRLDEIAVLHGPRDEREVEWIESSLVCRLMPGGRLAYLY